MAGAETRLERAHSILGLSNKLYGELAQVYQQMARISCSDPGGGGVRLPEKYKNSKNLSRIQSIKRIFSIMAHGNDII